MNHYNILGKSNCGVAMILENLYSIHGYDYDVDIIKNMNDNLDDNLPYDINNIKTNEFDHTEYEINLDVNNYIIGAVKVQSKRAIFDFFKENYCIDRDNYCCLFPNNVMISQTCQFGFGCILNYGCVLAPYVTLDDFVYLNRSVSIGHHTTIGEFTTINPGVNIAGRCKIGKNVTIGIGANIIDGITIGDNSIVGAGSLVLKDIPDNVIVYGNPAKIIKNLNNH